MTKTIFLDMKTEARIRKAYRAGRKKIEIGGRMFTIKKITRKVNYTTGGVQTSRKESWLVINPANGDFLPSAQIEVKPMENLRSVMS